MNGTEAFFRRAIHLARRRRAVRGGTFPPLRQSRTRPKNMLLQVRRSPARERREEQTPLAFFRNLLHRLLFSFRLRPIFVLGASVTVVATVLYSMKPEWRACRAPPRAGDAPLLPK